MTWLAAGASWFFADWAGDGKSSLASVSGLVGGVILSRVGLWGYDLAAQNIIQDVRFLFLCSSSHDVLSLCVLTCQF